MREFSFGMGSLFVRSFGFGCVGEWNKQRKREEEEEPDRGCGSEGRPEGE